MVNKVPSHADREAMAADVAEIYGVDVAGVLPLSEDIVSNASGGLFSLTDPDHEWSVAIAAVVDRLAG